MTVYIDTGPHPKRPDAHCIVEKDDACEHGTEFVYYGYLATKMMCLYPADKFTATHSRIKRIDVRRIRREKKDESC